MHSCLSKAMQTWVLAMRIRDERERAATGYCISLMRKTVHSCATKALAAWAMCIRIREERECAATALAERWKRILGQHVVAAVRAFVARLKKLHKVTRTVMSMHVKRRGSMLKRTLNGWREYTAWRALEERRSGTHYHIHMFLFYISTYKCRVCATVRTSIERKYLLCILLPYEFKTHHHCMATRIL